MESYMKNDIKRFPGICYTVFWTKNLSPGMQRISDSRFQIQDLKMGYYNKIGRELDILKMTCTFWISLN